MFEPINGPATLTYDTAGRAVSARCLQLNFTLETDASRRAAPLVVQAAGRDVTFTPVEMSRDLLSLLQVGALSSAPTTIVSFPLLTGEAEQQVTDFAWNVTKFCGLVARQLTPPVRLDLLDMSSEVVRVEFYSPVRTSFSKASRYLLVGLNFPKGGLADFFRQCYDQFVVLEQSPSWRHVFNLAWTYEDGAFLETRIGTVMAAVELLLRLSLEEAGITLGGRLRNDSDPPNLGQLISAARGQLRWNIPKHYTRLERYRHARNAAVHARNLPCSPREALDLLQKWGLFLYRRLLIRLGFTGNMWAASKGFSTVTKVDDFDEDANDFTHRDGA